MSTTPIVAILMASKSDWEVKKVAADTLAKFGISYEAKVLSAHRTPKAACAEGRGVAEPARRAQLPAYRDEQRQTISAETLV